MLWGEEGIFLGGRLGWFWFEDVRWELVFFVFIVFGRLD